MPAPADRSALERLALSEWSPAAEARVDSVLVRGSVAAINLLVNGHYEYSATFQRSEDGAWQEVSSSSGHVTAADLGWVDSE